MYVYMYVHVHVHVYIIFILLISGITLQSSVTDEVTKIREILLKFKVSRFMSLPVAMAISLLATVWK